MDNCLIGYVGLINQTMDGEAKTELGYRLYPAYWGQGLASEASEAVCRYAFTVLGKKEFISIIDPNNVRSVAVAKRLGMHYWRDYFFHKIPVQVFILRS